jgi:hypothetical protein
VKNVGEDFGELKETVMC